MSNSTQPKLLILTAFLLIGYLTPCIVNAQIAQMERIYHIPESKTIAGLPLNLECRIENGTAPPVSAQVFYRTQGKTAFSFIDLDIDELQLSATIPGSEINPPGIEYYFQANLPSGIILTFPVGAPMEREPFRVDVLSEIEAGSADRAVTIINPNRGSRIKGEEVVIAIGINQHVRPVNPDDLRLELNGVDITRYAIISMELVSFISNRIRNGKHRIALYEIRDGDKDKLVEWTFESEGVTKGAVTKGKNVGGSVTVKFNQEEISARQRDVALLDGRINGEYKGLDLSGKLYITSLENKNLQSQNRYLGVIRHKKLTVKIGDTQPRFSQFTMWGSRNRGMEVNFRTASMNFSLAVGSLLRSIEGTSKTVIDTTYELDTVGDTTDVVIDTSIVTDVSGTYKRTLFSFSPSFQVSRYGFISFNFLKAKDQLNSISYGIKPKDNLVFGADVDLTFLDRLIKFNSETAISLYNGDISPGPLAQAESMKDYIVVNQYFEPLPADSAIFDETAGTGELALSVFRELFKSSMAHQTSLGLNLRRNQVNLTYKTVGQSFHSLGSSAIQTDIHGFSISDRIRLFNNRVYLNLGYDSFSDNVNERSANTMNRSTFSGGFSVYTSSKYPNLSFNTRLYNRSKDTEIVYVKLPDGTFDSTGNPINDKTSSFDISLDQDFRFKGFDNNAVFVINRSQSSDKYNYEAASDVTSITLRLSSQRERKLETNIALSHTDQNSISDQNKINYNVASARARYLFLPQYKVWLFGGINTTLADGGYSPVLDNTITVAGGYKIDFIRLEFLLGIDTKPRENHSIGLNFYKVNHTDNGSTTKYWWDTTAGRWMTKSTKNTDQATYIQQDDFAIKLRYTYTF